MHIIVIIIEQKKKLNEFSAKIFLKRLQKERITFFDWAMKLFIGNCEKS